MNITWMNSDNVVTLIKLYINLMKAELQLVIEYKNGIKFNKEQFKY